MTKVFKWLEDNAVKIIMTVVITWGLFFGILYIQSIKKDIVLLRNQVTKEQSLAEDRFMLNLAGLSIIIDSLEDLAQSQQFIIDQNREKCVETKKVISETTTKPTYEELKSHNVYIVGCSNKILSEDKRIDYPIVDNGFCWAGSGVVIKITDTETYILTNKHVAGGEKDNIHLYIENGKSKFEAKIVKFHPYVDIAVIKITGKLNGKVAIPGIATAYIQDPIYIVGNPLAVKNIYSEGVVAGYRGMDMLLQVPCIYGNSGSGVFNSDGKLIGVVYALETYSGFLGIPEARITHSLVIDSISIKTFLKDLGLYND